MPIHFHDRPSLVAYVTCGDPDLPTTREIVLAAIAAGAAVVELGVPFSDPVADGAVIQQWTCNGTSTTMMWGLWQGIPGTLALVDARSGKVLSKFKVGSGVVGNPITYRAPDGRQYVAVYAGIGGDWEKQT